MQEMIQSRLKIAFTFDDGPHVQNTVELLNVAAEYGARWTFFVVGNRISRHGAIVQRQSAEGHEIGNHSWSHPDFLSLDPGMARTEVEKTEIALAELGIRPRLFRPPYGRISDDQRGWITRELGYKIVLWTIDSLDWQNQPPSGVVKRLLSRNRPGEVVLFHDIHGVAIRGIRRIVESLLAGGFEFVTVSELLDDGSQIR